MKRYFLIIMVLCVLAIACSAMIACNSSEDPIPSKYTGTYSNYMYGSIELTTTKVSSNQLLVPECKMNGQKLESPVLSWLAVSFDYQEDMTYSFTANATDSISGKSGNVSFNGQIVDNLLTYNAWLYYTDGKAIILSKEI